MAQFRVTFHYELQEAQERVSKSVRSTIYQNGAQQQRVLSAASGDDTTLKAVLSSNSLGAPNGTTLIIDNVSNHDQGARNGGTVLS